MTARRRRTRRDYDDEVHPSPSFNWGNIANMAVIPFITAVVLFVGQWAVQGDTTKRNETQIAEDRKARETMRESFMDSQKKLVDVLGKIDTRLSVTEKAQENAVKQIDKLGDLVIKLSPSPQPVERRR